MLPEEYYLRIPLKAFTDSRLTRAAICVYGVLIAAADKRMKVEDLTVDEIASRCCVTEKTVRNAERLLVSAGYIQIEPTGRGSRIWVSHYLQPQPFDVFEAMKAAEEEAHYKETCERLGIPYGKEKAQ